MDTAYSLQIYEICGEKATFSFFLKKEEKTRAGKRGTGSAGKRMREEENGRGEKDRKSVPPETEKGTGAEGKGRIPGWNTRHGTPEALPHEAAGKAVAPITETALRPDTKKSRPRQGRDKSANPRGCGDSAYGTACRVANSRRTRAAHGGRSAWRGRAVSCRTSIRPVALQPLFVFEIPDGQRRAEDHQADGKDIAQGDVPAVSERQRPV